MVFEEIQNALEKIESNQEYCQELKLSPGKLALDFGLSEEECKALQSGNSLNHVDKSIRPVALCCTCVVAVVQPTEN